MSIQSAVEEVEQYIISKDSVTMVEIERIASKHIQIEGPFQWCYYGAESTVIWDQMSSQFLEVMREISVRKKVISKPVSPLVYRMDGKSLESRYPVTSMVNNYDIDHWMPLSFSAANIEENAQ
jgi:hypothetical protein